MGKLAVGNKKDEEAEGIERRGGGLNLKVGGLEMTVSPWTPNSNRGIFYDEYTSFYIMC